MEREHWEKAKAALLDAGDGRNFATDSPQVAQTHAILALAEQQRIANLISLASLPVVLGVMEDHADVLRNAALATLAHYESSPPDYEATEIDNWILAELEMEQ